MTAIAAPPARLARVVPATVVAQGLAAVIVATLVVTRADGGSLSPVALAGLTVGAAMASVLIAWPAGLYAGAAAVLDGDGLDCSASCPARRDGDPFAFASLWRSTLALVALVGAWALAGAGLLVAVLDNRPARAVVVFAALAGVAGVAAVVVDAAARHRGAHAAVRLQVEGPTRVGLRHRAWREIALPLAGAQALVNAGVAWLLFHDDPARQAGVAHELTRASALSDLAIMVTLLALLFALALPAAWAATDARLGRLALDDPEAQRPTARSPIGPQAIVYAGLGALAVSRIVAWALPKEPSLVQVMVARGLFAGALVAVFAALGYVRGALNALVADS